LQASLWLKDPLQKKALQSGNWPTVDDVAQHLLFDMLRTLELDDAKTADAIKNRPEAARTLQQQLPEGKRARTGGAAVQEPFERQGIQEVRQNATKDANGRAVPIDTNNQTPAAPSSMNRMVHGERIGLKGWVQYHAVGSQAVAVKLLIDTIVALGVQALIYNALGAKVEAAPLSPHAETCVYMTSRLAACIAVLKHENGKEHMRERRILLAGVAAEPHEGARHDPRGWRGRVARVLGLHRSNAAVAEAERRRLLWDEAVRTRSDPLKVGDTVEARGSGLGVVEQTSLRCIPGGSQRSARRACGPVPVACAAPQCIFKSSLYSSPHYVSLLIGNVASFAIDI